MTSSRAFFLYKKKPRYTGVHFIPKCKNKFEKNRTRRDLAKLYVASFYEKSMYPYLRLFEDDGSGGRGRRGIEDAITLTLCFLKMAYASKIKSGLVIIYFVIKPIHFLFYSSPPCPKLPI